MYRYLLRIIFTSFPFQKIVEMEIIYKKDSVI